MHYIDIIKLDNYEKTNIKFNNVKTFECLSQLEC